MGIFDKIFGSKKEKSSENSTNQDMRLEYNVMKNISIGKSLKYENSEQFKPIENGIYQDLKDNDDTKYRMTICYELEPDNETNNQYPLEDILDKYYLYVADFLETENHTGPNKFKLELAGELTDIKNGQKIIGKKVYNQEFEDDDGQIRVHLKIE
ncbi:hypothetical protein [Nonlabens ulvanivorans]|uniref:Uncharacterized protein n=2 Tax=Nonlabens ulvanivorans TaxID=906888 RepID=A0ABX5E5P0_NONUL|nr:hypothetical protein [Nonlabens ulvanivorans]PRX14254.1 hypothetical protein LY02_01284 [Nonlabens ulvanivorans]